MKKLKSLQAKYLKRGLAVVGINVDGQRGDAAAYVRSNRISWPQLHELGGLDSRLADELGIMTLPTMLLIDKQGRVVNRNIHGAELETELGKLIK